MLIRVLLVRSGRVELPLSAPEANVLSTGLRARVHCEQKIVYHGTHDIVNLIDSGVRAHTAGRGAPVLDEIADMVRERGEDEIKKQ